MREKKQACEKLPCNIFLIGFMGTGKSTIAKALQQLTAAEIIEMDQQIEKQEGKAIPEIFAQEGEAYFRSLETELLKNTRTGEAQIISCGGGVPMREENVAVMKANGMTVLLTAAPETILERVEKSNDRPLLEGNKNVAFIRELMRKRKDQYDAAADVLVRTDGKTAEAIAEEILQVIRQKEAGI